MTRDNEARLKGCATSVIENAAPDFDGNQLKRAKQAVDEAISVISTVEFEEMPRMDVTDEGAFMLLWQRGDVGVALFFSGEGSFSFSTKSGPDDYYASGYEEHRVTGALRGDQRSKIIELSKRNDLGA